MGLHVRGVIEKYGECLNKKNYYSKRHIAINPPQNTPPRFEHTYPIVLATFWSGSGSPLSWVSLVALSWLPRCPESIQNIYISWSFWLGDEPEVARCQIRWIRWMRTHHNIFIWQKLPYQKQCVTRSVVMPEDETVCQYLRSFLRTSFLKSSNEPL